nr:MAG TPA: hypothetical protein [Caudoviricetes sp.]
MTHFAIVWHYICVYNGIMRVLGKISGTFYFERKGGKSSHGKR